MKTKTEISDRQKFIDVYNEFDKWLYSLGFRQPDFKERSTPMDFHYSFYNKYIDSLDSVECFKQYTLNLSIYFLRDRNEHKFMFVGSFFSHSEVMSIDKAKQEILKQVKELRDKLLKELNKISDI